MGRSSRVNPIINKENIVENSSVLTIIDKLLSEKVDFDIRISVKEGKGYVRCQLNSRKG